MSIPKNPNIVVLKNNFYPDGLAEIDVWNYYQKYKGVILNNTRGRDLMFVIIVDLNKPIIKRRGLNNNFIQLTNSNYDSIISGRSLVIYSTMKAYEDFCIIDIDTNDWKKAVNVTTVLYKEMKKANFIKSVKILYTGKNSFHLHCKFIDKMPIDRIKNITLEYLRQNSNPSLFTILNKRTSDLPNLDLSPNKFRGAFITEGSLSLWGLRCMNVPISKISSFNQRDAKI